MYNWVFWFSLINWNILVQAAYSESKYSCGESNHTDAVIRRDLNFTQLVEHDGYRHETYKVTTIDGYILKIFRVLRKKACSAFVGPPIVCCHGLYLSGDDWLVPGPGRAHAYLYADECRDVWVINVRGNLYSREHVSLDPDEDPQFWAFDWGHMGLYDIPACIDFVLEKTGKSQVAYVCHSQGGTALLELCAKKPEYNGKIAVAFGLSMTAILDHARFVVLQVQKYLAPLIAAATRKNVNTEILPRGAFYQPLAKGLCGTVSSSYLPCSLFYYALLGYDEGQLCEDVLTVMTGHIPSGTSLMNFNRWGQVKRYGFRERDYGADGNRERYNRTVPPLIDVSGVTLPWRFIGGRNDYVGDVRDVQALAEMLPDAAQCVVSDDTIGHLDHVFGKIVPVVTVPMITKYIDTGVFECL